MPQIIVSQPMIAIARDQGVTADQLQKPQGLLTTILLQIVAAQRRLRERDQLVELSDAALKDLGLTRTDVWAELRKPVWRR
jgi:uncharacterized protein YjiS (DUF1127 family)